MQTAPEPLLVERTDGSKIYLADGRCLIDGVASWWTACHGYNHPHIREAVERQLASMPHVMLGGMVHPPILELSKKIASILPGDLGHIFYSESGSVAVEVAMKMALQFWINQGRRERRKFLSFRFGYHGDTFAAMSVCDPIEGMHALFAETLAKQIMVEIPSTAAEHLAFDAIVAEHADQLAAVIIEPLVQGAGGMKFHDAATLASITATARRYGLLVIFDEIATGFGRTGTMFAMDQAGVVPDIVTLSKALTGGTMPLAATVASEYVYAAFCSDEEEHALMHGPTFSGNPLACAAAIASLELFESQPRIEQAIAIETSLKMGLESCVGLPGVVDVRTRGAIGVIQLEPPIDIADLRREFVAAGVWVRPFGNIVYLLPALTITSDELDQLIAAVTSIVGKWSERRPT
jgi:adenosylmethionine-8-amino-7-oxononanoate aminotransferase